MTSLAVVRYAAYSPEYLYAQGLYSPYMGQQQYLQVYGLPGTGDPAVYPYGQLSQTIPGGHGYTAMQGYGVPGHQIVQLTGPGMNTITSPPTPTGQSSYPTGAAAIVPSQQQLRLPAPTELMQGGGSTG
ncbi:hypothetical protein SAY86_012275 [Trapa natans]|uniref:Uncharacterized protein n=1 Tax=Trapa natans TaxID=22666 RepID=A0AAN7RBF9_TRANT|nr:hypothetical protein SAY86_012275 [Trapa natans]